MTTFKSSEGRPGALLAAVKDRVVVEEVVFRENAGSAAGVYTGSVVVPQGSILLDVVVHAEALWNAGTSAAMIVGDQVDPNGFFDAIDLKATDLLAAEGISFGFPGGQQGADVVSTLTAGTPNTTASMHANRRYLTARRTITGEITTVGTAGTAGVTRMVVVYARPGTPVDATFVAT